MHAQDGVLLHTINRATGRVHIWKLPFVFFSFYICNCFDTEGGGSRRGLGITHYLHF